MAYVKRGLRGNILDPSMEAGQLLLAVAESWKDKVIAEFGESSQDARRLVAAGWRHLCDNLLFGVDRNPLALTAVRYSFEAACSTYGLRPSYPRNLFTADFILNQRLLGDSRFRVVLNNPPWGEKNPAGYSERMRQTFAACRSYPDSYLAYVERAVNLLEESGALAVVLPASFVSAAKAAELRRLISDRLCLESISILPREVFSDAAVRSVAVFATAKTSGKGKSCILSHIPDRGNHSQQYNLAVSQDVLADSGREGWTKLFQRGPLRSGEGRFIPLGRLARVAKGFRLPADCVVCETSSHDGRECERLFRDTLPFGYSPLLEARAVKPWEIAGIGKHICTCRSSEGDSSRFEVHVGRRIVIRDIVLPDGRIGAARVSFKAVPLNGVITVTSNRINLDLLLALLNSDVASKWVASTGPCLTRANLSKLRKGDILDFPIPDRCAGRRAIRSGLCREIVEKSALLSSALPGPADSKSARDELDALVAELYAD